MASRVSEEPAAEKILAAMDKEAALHCDMCLGEGSAKKTVTLFPILDLATQTSVTTDEHI